MFGCFSGLSNLGLLYTEVKQLQSPITYNTKIYFYNDFK